MNRSWHGFDGCDTIPHVQNQLSLKQIYAPIEAVITDVRQVVQEMWHDVMALVSATSAQNNTQQAEGKLLRPALCLLAAGALSKQNLTSLAKLAAAYELMHLASLAHDDVVDHASLRRGQESLNMQWDNHAAILGGDYLVACALELLMEYESNALVLNALQTMRFMAEGELRYYGHDSEKAEEADCIALANSKTASLFAAACTAPALLVSPEYTEAMHNFGIGLGIAFQLLDDLLDLTQPASVLGKPACGDITEGKHTLPLFMLRHALNSSEREQLTAMTGKTLSEEEQGWVREVVTKREIDKATCSRAEQYINQATAAIAPLPDSVFKDSMTALAHFVLVRQA